MLEKLYYINFNNIKLSCDLEGKLLIIYNETN